MAKKQVKDMTEKKRLQAINAYNLSFIQTDIEGLEELHKRMTDKIITLRKHFNTLLTDIQPLFKEDKNT